MTPPVLLVRHAEAEAGGPDAARRLSARGRQAFGELLGTLAGQIPVTRILASPFRRAQETAAILAAATGARVETCDELASGRSGGREVLALVRESGPGVALVGHNPEVAEALALVAGENLPVWPGTVAALGVAEGALRLLWARSP